MGSLAFHAIVRALGLPALARLRERGVILCYHNVVPDSTAATAEPSVHCGLGRFTQHMTWLVTHYQCVSLAEFTHRLRTGQSLRQLASVTFDDGYAGVFQHAWPVLRELGVPATVFLVAGAGNAPRPFWWDLVREGEGEGAERGRWLIELSGDGGAIATQAAAQAVVASEAQLPADWELIRRAMGPGLSLGAHTVTHRSLTQLPDDELWTEVATSRDIIASQTGVAPDFFAYPYGLWSVRVRSVARAVGYQGALTLDYGLNRTGADPWALRRVNVPASISLPALETWTAGLRPPGRR